MREPEIMGVMIEGLPPIVKPVRHPRKPWARGKVLQYLYVFRCETFHKIGISRDPAERLNDLRNCCPFPIIPVCYRRLHASRSVSKAFEQTVHGELTSFRMHGEWFRADLETILAACAAIVAKVKEERKYVKVSRSDGTAAAVLELSA